MSDCLFIISGKFIKIGKWSVILFLIIPEILSIFAFINILSISDLVVINSPFAYLDVDMRVGSVIVGTR